MKLNVKAKVKNYQAAVGIRQKSENGNAGTIKTACGKTSHLTKMGVRMDLYLIYIYSKS